MSKIWFKNARGDAYLLTLLSSGDFVAHAWTGQSALFCILPDDGRENGMCRERTEEEQRNKRLLFQTHLSLSLNSQVRVGRLD